MARSTEHPDMMISIKAQEKKENCEWLVTVFPSGKQMLVKITA
ncbi:MAG: hypothetical protein OSA92_08255 [Pirellulaceae bacterium]|jgi:hypothetical protein|nr:hypothetical protein [Pirellulaceae bacterium]|tara:strand:+ start:1482 stop:1610 length:129 start_codon:yes stop_codon:yes gene_type:complete